MDSELTKLLLQGIAESLYMTVVSTLIAYALGLPLGVLLSVTAKNGLHPLPVLNKSLGFLVNFLRSIPFIILLVAVMPFTRAVVGTTLGSTATIVPLVIAAAPFVARMVESSIKEVDAGIIEAAQSMGSSNWKIIWKVLLPEAKPSLVIGSAITVTTILSYSAMAGFTGGGGLGVIAINYGYYGYQSDIMLITVLLLVVIVQIFQELGIFIARRTDKRKE